MSPCPLRLLLILPVLIAGGDLFAQGVDTATLRTVVVSASKVPRPASTLSQAVTVLSGEDLRARGITRVSEALREVPGATLVQSGSYGALTSLFLRGGESRYTKVLIDGVAVNAPGGFFDFSHLTTDNIERIEIVRGPASVLYGADAASGIVQIFTRRGDGRRASLGARGGTYHTFDADADAAGSSSFGTFSAGAGRHSSDGILPFNNQYRNGTLSSALTLGSRAGGEAKISGRYTAAEFHYPTDFTGAPVDSNAYRVQHRLTVGLDAGHDVSANIHARLLAGSNDVTDLTEDIATPFGSATPQHSAFRSRAYRRDVDGRLTIYLPREATLTGGATFEREHENSLSWSGPVGGGQTQTDSFDASRHNVAYYLELLGDASGRASYTLSGRVDDNSDYRRYATYRLGLNAAPIQGLRVRASLSTAFNAPAFNQLRPTLYTVGSPGLQPERIRSGEVGLITAFAPNFIQASASYFTQRFDDLIQYVNGAPPSYKGSYANLTGAAANGYEVELDVLPAATLRGSANYTVVNPRVTEVAPTYQGADRVGDALLRRPTHMGGATLTYAPRVGASLSLAARYVGRRPDVDFAQFPSPRVTLPAYTRIDLSAELPLAHFGPTGLAMSARVDNLFDRRYEEVLHFATPRRTLFVGARARAIF